MDIIRVLLLTTALSAQNLLNQPESILYDAGQNRYLISNFGDGAIVQIDSLGGQSYFSTEFQNTHQIVGIFLMEGILHAAVNNGPTAGIAFFDIQTGGLTDLVPIPGYGLMNDITSDMHGNLYITDYYESRIYRIAAESHDVSVLAYQNLPNPNGIAYDHLNNRLLTVGVSGAGRPILAVELDGSVTILGYTYLTGMDGISLDPAGNIYVSDWGTDSVVRYPNNMSEPGITVSDGHLDPADISVCAETSELLVPNFSSNSIDIVHLDLEPPCELPGDLNGDLVIDILDIVLTMNCILGGESGCFCADLDQNGIINVLDIVMMINIIMA